MKAKSIISAVLAVCAGVTLAGCSSHAGAAAVINGTTYTEEQLDTFIKEMYVTEEPSRARALDAMLRIDAFERPIIEKHAEEMPEDIKVESYRSCADAEGNEVTSSSPQPRRIQCEFDYLQSINPDVEKEMTDMLETAKIEINPRYSGGDVDVLGVSSDS